MKPRARFEIVENIVGKPLVIRDVGPWDKHPSVTNDAEAVVAYLSAPGDRLLEDGRQLLYYDSDGHLDEIVVVEGRFAGFKPGPKR